MPPDQQDEYAPDQHLLPENDPEHDGEVRYQRIPRENKENGPKRIWEKCGLTYVKDKAKKYRKISVYRRQPGYSI